MPDLTCVEYRDLKMLRDLVQFPQHWSPVDRKALARVDAALAAVEEGRFAFRVTYFYQGTTNHHGPYETLAEAQAEYSRIKNAEEEHHNRPASNCPLCVSRGGHLYDDPAHRTSTGTDPMGASMTKSYNEIIDNLASALEDAGEFVAEVVVDATGKGFVLFEELKKKLGTSDPLKVTTTGDKAESARDVKSCGVALGWPEQDLRKLALELAVAHCRNGEGDVLKQAKEYYDFLAGQTPSA